MKRFSLLLALLACALRAAALQVNHLRVQSLPNPQGVDAPAPRFSWQLRSGCALPARTRAAIRA